jgi:hypothetical protein
MPSRLIAVVLTVAALLPCGPVQALEPREVANALGRALVNKVATTSFESATFEDDNVVIRGFVATMSQAYTVSADVVTISNPSEDDNGLIASSEVTLERATFDHLGRPTTIAEISWTDVMIPAKSDQLVLGTGFAQNLLFTDLRASDIRTDIDDKTPELTVERLFFRKQLQPQLDAVGLTEGLIKGIVAPFKALNEEMFGGLADVGERVALDVSWRAETDPATGLLKLQDLTISLDEGGSWSVSGVASDFPVPGASAVTPDALNDVKVHEVTIRYDDNSLIGHMLDTLARNRSLSRAEATEQLKNALPVLVMGLDGVEFPLSRAIGEFLLDPRSLSIKVAPEKPVSIAQLIALAETDRGALPQLLSASVEVNLLEAGGSKSERHSFYACLGFSSANKTAYVGDIFSSERQPQSLQSELRVFLEEMAASALDVTCSTYQNWAQAEEGLKNTKSYWQHELGATLVETGWTP